MDKEKIPALIGVPMVLEEIHTGMQAIVDGFQREVIFEPLEELCNQAKIKMKEEQEKQQLLQNLKGKEDNPAMGYRAICICLKQTDIFKTQLRALLRAASFGNIPIMYPMITSAIRVCCHRIF